MTQNDDVYRELLDSSLVQTSSFESNYYQVYSFVLSIISQLLPIAFWGVHNWKVLRNNISHFIKLKRFEGIKVCHLLQNMKILEFSWNTAKHPSCRQEYIKIQNITAQLLCWVFEVLLVNVIKASFYVTESGNNKNKCAYIRHDIWMQLTASCFQSSDFNSIFSRMPNKFASAYQTINASIHKIRLLPKKTGFRNILNLSKKYPSTSRILGSKGSEFSSNQTLASALTVLKFERLHNPYLVGNSVFSMNEIHGKLLEFKQKLKRTG